MKQKSKLGLETNDFQECWLIAYSLFLSGPTLVIREVTVCNPFKTKQTKHKHNETIHENKKKGTHKSKAQQNTANTCKPINANKDNERIFENVGV